MGVRGTYDWVFRFYCAFPAEPLAFWDVRYAVAVCREVRGIRLVGGLAFGEYRCCAPWWTARLQPSQNTIAFEFSPSPSSQTAHFESSFVRFECLEGIRLTCELLG